MRFFSDLWIIITQLYSFNCRVAKYIAKQEVPTQPADWAYHVANLRDAYYREMTYLAVDLPDNEPNHEPAAYRYNDLPF